jgi:hypothetical protein
MSNDGDMPVIEYGTKRRPNVAAMVSLAFGLMLFVPMITGVLAIVFGRRGMRAARERSIGRYHMARAGLGLGVANVLLSLVVGTAYGVHEYHAARQRRCAQNLKQIGLAILLYTNENRGQYPPTLDHLVSTGQLPKGSPVFSCPVCIDDATKRPATTGATVSSSYLLSLPWKPSPGPWLHGGIPPGWVVASEPLSNHDGRGINVLIDDGHVEWLDAQLAAKVLTELRAGENPPKALRGRTW